MKRFSEPAARRLAAWAGAALLLAGTASAQLSAQGGPIRVSADESSVLERDRRVLVIGNVDIIQGEARLRANEVTLHYSGRSGAAAGGLGGGFGDIQRMEADGEVFYITPELRATGNYGVYDAATDTITLTGNVVLVRGEDVARGCELVLEVEAGRSNLKGCDENGRVQILINPEPASGPDTDGSGGT